MKRFLSILPLVVMLLASPLMAQDDNDEPQTVSLPDETMERVVRQVVVSHFRSYRGDRKVFFSDQNIKAEWLPKMRSVEFVVNNDHEGDVHFFNEVMRVEGGYEVQFGWGDPDCSATGDTYRIEINGHDVLVTKVAGGWGSGCGRSSH